MPVNRGRNISQKIRELVADTASELYDASLIEAFPSAPQVREAVSKKLPKQILNWHTDQPGERVPSVRAIQDIIAPVRAKLLAAKDLEAPWSLGLSTGASIADEATGALLRIWQWTILQPLENPFTVRMAKWISKLRWVPEAGGSPNGEVSDPEKMYTTAVRYSGRERRAYLAMDEAGMRSGVLDASLMLEPDVATVYRHLGLLTDDTGISHAEDVALVAPEFKRYMHVRGRFEAGLTPYLEAEVTRLAERFHEFGTPETEQRAHKIFNGAITVLTSDERYSRFTHEQNMTCVDRLLDDFISSFQTSRDVRSWQPLPKIKELLEKIAE